MPASETLSDLVDLFLFDDAVVGDLELAAAARPRPDAQWDVRVVALGGEAEAYFRDVIRTAVLFNVDGWRLRKLDPLYKPDADQIEWSDVSDVPEISLAIDRYANLSAFAPFDEGDDDFKRRMVYWVSVLTAADQRKAFFFRSFSASAELERKRGAAFVARDGTFQRVSERIFLFDESIDSFAFGDYVFVIRKYDFRRVFDQLAAVRRRAVRVARELHARVPIANIDAFTAACSAQVSMADKLIAVRKSDYFEQLSYDLLQPVIDEFNLSIPIQAINGVPHLVFETSAEKRWRILNLIDDDYLRSSMTGHRYEVNSKTEAPRS
jgi:Kiwa protein KwaB-like